MKFGKEERILKLDECQGSLPNPFTSGSGPLAMNINQDKCLGQTGFWICMSFISQLRALQVATMRQAGTMDHHIVVDQENEH